MRPRIAGSDVYIVSDLERILVALAGASGRYSGDYSAGYQDALRDLASAVGASIAMPCERIHEVIEYRHERTIERYAQPAQVEAYQTQPALAMADVEFHDFVPGKGEVRRMESGWMWLGNDGSKVFYPVQQWVEIAADDARRLGYLIADNRTFILAVRSLAEARMRRLGQSVSVLPTERRQLR